MDRRSTLYALLIFGGLLGACFLFALILFTSLDSADEGRKGWSSGPGPKIGVVEIKGVILESRETIERLVEFRRDKAIKAIVVRVDSPGGSVGPSQEIFRAIQRARKDKKVVISMGSVAASGGLYIAVAGDRIFASPGTITGSIGVISEIPDLSGLLDLTRVHVTTIKSGALKDAGSPLRPMTADEKQYFQKFVNAIYEQFLSDVASSRNLSKDEVRKVADGRVLTGQQALELKLIDEIGNLEDALDGAAKLAGEKGDPVPVFARKKQSFVQELFRDGAEGAAGAIRDQLQQGSTVELRDPRLR
ncbi:MAG: signal peptide peptidase SppA [Myxococcales bacterium]|nr:signal peptide peptidase SppA [Myxococcales bacterium]